MRWVSVCCMPIFDGVVNATNLVSFQPTTPTFKKLLEKRPLLRLLMPVMSMEKFDEMRPTMRKSEQRTVGKDFCKS